ncbi:MFS transporter [Arthrobacter sp. ISL-5]|uniref:MFS transporter n=1 Tax=Arthrobacter sp. ISL-5 TaxID=2819111 RepID=UPI001BE81B62|nr:MFS transporter [Arthrobacter sp. ISL-5]MBT2551501.1 MFS transporter [Arthrobacter sp. ISL-5]
MSREAGAPGQETTAAQPWNPRLALLVAATFFMEFLDGTVLTTAIPSIAVDFGVPAAGVNITMTAYLMTVAMGIPLSGWLAERLGARRVFCLAIAVFTVASLLCAASQDLTMLTLSRVLQGFGGAMMVPVGTLVVLRGTPKSELLRATAYLVWPGLLAPVLAPLVGGALTTYLSWHWIFLINLPLGAAAFLAALRLVPAVPGDRHRRLDWAGLALTTAGVGALVVGLELASGHPEGPWTWLSIATGVLALAAAAVWMRRAANPLFDLTVFATRTFRATNTGGFIYRLTISAVPFLLPLMFQEGFGWSPLHAGIMVAAVFIGNIGIKPATTPLIRRFGFKPVLVFASLASAMTFALCALLTPETPEPLIFALLVCSGALRSIGFSAYASVQYADIVPGQLTSANAVSAALVQLATGAGIAVGALLLRVFDSAAVLASGLGGVLGASTGDGGVAAYRGAFLSIAVLMLLSTVDSLMLHRNAGAEVSRPGPAPAAEPPRRRPA